MESEYRGWENRITAARRTARENLDRELTEISLKVVEDFDETAYDELEDML